jgi:PmbA protein
VGADVNLEALLAALAQTRSQGHAIAGWSVYVAQMRRTNLGTKDRQTGDPHAPLTLADSLTARYRLVWDDGRVSRGTMERRAIEREPDAVLAAARAASFHDPDATGVLGPASFPEVATHDAATAAIAAGGVEAFAPRLAAIRERAAEHRIRTWSGSMHAADGTARVVTSSGLDVSGTGTSGGWSATLDGELSAGQSARAIEPVDELEERLDRLVAFVLALRTAAGSRPGGVVPVLLHPDVVEEYVLGVLLHNLEGSQVAHGTGAFRREQFGAASPALREDLTLRVDPLLPLSAGAYRFSQDGLPARPSVFIERGRLMTPVLDLKYARRLGLAPTAVPSAMDALFFEGPKAVPYEDALHAAAGGALVLSVLGVHTQDFTSGDFSLSAPQTLAVGPAGLAGRSRSTISGNLFELLRSRDLLLVRFPGEHTPGLLVRCRLDAV